MNSVCLLKLSSPSPRSPYREKGLYVPHRVPRRGERDIWLDQRHEKAIFDFMSFDWLDVCSRDETLKEAREIPVHVVRIHVAQIRVCSTIRRGYNPARKCLSMMMSGETFESGGGSAPLSRDDWGPL